MRSMSRLLVLSSLCLGGCVTLRWTQRDPVLALVGATVIDGSGGDPIADATILVREGLIVGVGPRTRVAVPRRADVVDLAGATIIPGLIDSHVHLGMTAMERPGGEPDLSRLGEFLRYGVTTIRDPGDAYPWILDVRAKIASGRLAGPRILAAGPTITAPAGHPAATLLNGRPEAAALGTRQVRTPAEAVAAVSELATGGVDFIKAVYDGGNRRSPFGLLPKLEAQTLRAVVDESRRRRLPITVHWANTSELSDVIAAGPDQLEHIGVSGIPDSIIATMAARRIVVDPTLVVYEKMLPPELFSSLSMENATRLHRAGIALTAGTDAPLGGLAFGESLHHELELLVRAGLTPVEAIAAATGNAARAIRRDREFGTLRPGLRADLIVLDADPRASIANTKRIRFVMAGGRRIER